MVNLIDKGIDTGEILFQNSFEINPTDTCNMLYEKYIYYGIQLVYKRIDNLINDEYEPRIQDSKGSTYLLVEVGMDSECQSMLTGIG